MQKVIELGIKMSKQLDKNWLSELEEVNMYKLFAPVYALPFNIITLNTIVTFIILAYDSDSKWIDLRRDRMENKLDILKSLDANISDEIYQSLIYLDVDDFQEIVAQYLQRQQDWRFRTVVTCFDFHSKHIRSATEPIKAIILDDLEKAKTNKAKGELLKEAIRQREVGEQLLLEIKKDHVKLDHITQGEFGFTASDIEKVDIMSWRSFIKSLKTPTH